MRRRGDNNKRVKGDYRHVIRSTQSKVTAGSVCFNVRKKSEIFIGVKKIRAHKKTHSGGVLLTHTSFLTLQSSWITEVFDGSVLKISHGRTNQLPLRRRRRDLQQGFSGD